MTPRRRIIFGKLGSIIASLILAFKTRVLSDGGTFEGESCLNSQITSLRNLDLYPVGDAAMIALRDRVISDSGSFEAYNCGIIAVQSLANIDLN